ncbi:excisionase [Staphylococcus haemolyticus]|nr:excisionase [Staphylococcus haemolyticus]
MNIEFSDAEIAFIKESVESYSSEFDIHDCEQELKFNIYENIMRKIDSQYEKSYLFSIIN